jgi:thiol-disulfide isomerase/thioredoxin
VAPGAEVGDYVENFVLLSQTGEMVSLSNFCGKVVYVTMGAIWCSACTRWAQRLHIYAQKYPDDFVPIELLAESTHGQPGQPKDPPNAEELMAWAVEFQGPSPTAPVLADVGWEVYHRYFEGDPNLTGNVPQGLLIDREGRILSVGNVGFSNEVKDGDKIIDVTMYAIDEAVAAP